MIGVDLHMHSNFSDGELSPQQLMLLAKEKQLKIISLTDHDNLDGNVIAQSCAEKLGMEFIHGVEISSYWQRVTTQKSYPLHIVALDMQDLLPIEHLIAEQKKKRAERAHQICEKLYQILKTDFLPEIRALVDGHDDRITRSHIAKILVQKNVVSRMQQAFDRFLKEGKRAYVPFMGVSMAKAIEVIHESRGLAVLAHPTKYDLSAMNIRSMIEQFALAGGDAIELPPKQETVATRQMIDKLIEQYQLKVSLGSDFHGAHMPWLSLGNVPILKANQVGIWEEFK